MSTDNMTLITAQYNALRSRFTAQLDSTHLSDVSRTISDLSRDVLALPTGIAAVRSRGYAFANYLENKADVLAKLWDTARQEALHSIDTNGFRLRDELRRVEQAVREADALASTPEALQSRLPMVEQMINDMDSRISAATSHVRGVFASLESDIRQTMGQLTEIGWYLDQRDEASFKFLAGEALFLAAKAEWVATGKGKQDPDGILYLTDQRLVFEQKETTGKTLGLFGGKQTQELEWEFPLHQIAELRAENKGLFGGKDMLYFTLTAGARFPQLTLEVKGNANGKFWAAQVQRMISGGTADERAIQPDPELMDALRNAPSACPVCSGTIPQLTAGQRQVACPYCGNVIRF